MLRSLASILAVLAAAAACSQRDLHGSQQDEPSTARFAPAPGSPLRVGDGVQRPVLADMNSDRVPDIVVAYDEDAANGAGGVAVFLGAGDGRFRTPPFVAHVPMAHLKIAVGDVDGDGAPDVVAGAHDSYDVRVLRGDGRGALRDGGRTVRARAGTTPHTHSVVLADVDGDERLDLLTTNADHGDVSVLLGDGAGAFAPAPGSPFAAGNHPYEGMLVRDIDGDRLPDVVVPDLLGGAVSVLIGDGSGAFAPMAGSPYPVGPRPGSVGVGDLDGDGRVDVATTHDDDPLVSVLVQGDARFAPMAGSPFRLDQRAWDVAIVDLDGDGACEMVLGGVLDAVLIRSGGARDELVRAVGRGPGYLAFGDLDRDGRLDVVTGNFSGDDLSVLLGRAPLDAR